ncbi:uncharacterized protein LOC113496829 isoform X2 [Trichoplusia ni]|uniref:Uncharacterized protein LOC113496829 isoform X2 n=1 Tax=Trichoplusia ni TaxID=7111 RepID=A0A7E5VUQ7_TRINI|nr:uncharacterized protein LOC113496829 isoform X2 [Trichoplusia ni]
MHKITLFIFAALFAVTLAGQYYVPRAYYTIDAEGHESARVPLRRLRRSLPPPMPYGGANANAQAYAQANSFNGGSAAANANAQANAGGWGGWGGYGGWALPTGQYGSANPNALRT